MTKKSKIQTRKEDALSIVEDSELVDEIDATNALEAKSDVLIEMSDTDDEVETPLVEDSKDMKKDKMPMDDETPDDEMNEKEMADKQKKHQKDMKKSLTAEDVVEIVKSLLPEKVADTSIVTPLAKVDKSALDIATDELYNSVKSAIGLPGLTLEQKLEGINPSLQNLGTAITAMVKDSMGIENVSPTSNDQNLVLEAVTSLTNAVKALADEVAIIKEKSQTPSNVVNRVPVPRSIQPQLVAQSQNQAPVNPNSVRNLTRRSVSNGQLPNVPG